MDKFMDKHFLLKTDTAKELYHEIAAGLPIIDYHSHLSPIEIADGKYWRNITELWLGGDHYKWRLMRSAGIPEDFITGNADDQEKFYAFCKVLPLAIGNPIYHWSHLELQRIFNIDLTINEKNAPVLWEMINAKLAHINTHTLLEQAFVAVACTTDDPIDSLEYHAKIAHSQLKTRVLPAFRPDKAMRINEPDFAAYLEKLGSTSHTKINHFTDLIVALAHRIEFFHAQGARISDHAIDIPFSEESIEEAKLETLFQQRLSGKLLDKAALSYYQTGILLHLGQYYAHFDWAMCLHIGAQRNNNTRFLQQLGPDTGYDSIGDGAFAKGLAQFLDTLDTQQKLPKTALFCLNPHMNEVLSTLIGCFQDGNIAGKLQFGPAWWFNDHKEGNLEQLRTLAAHGVLGTFVGMVTDSRSFASYPRHDYFRRLLCRQIAKWVEDGEYPADFECLNQLIRGICFENATNYFNLS